MSRSVRPPAGPWGCPPGSDSSDSDSSDSSDILNPKQLLNCIGAKGMEIFKCGVSKCVDFCRGVDT